MVHYRNSQVTRWYRNQFWQVLLYSKDERKRVATYGSMGQKIIDELSYDFLVILPFWQNIKPILIPDTFDFERQNLERTEGYSNSIVRKNSDKFGKKIGFNK